MKINQLPFLSVVDDITSKFNKIPKKNFKIEGQYPIIDQGFEFVAGYTNEQALVTDLKYPVIIFGDHTRVFKYADFPFAIGADGVKVLLGKPGIVHPEFLFFLLKSLTITSAGYSRHFKFLKGKKLPIPDSIEDQKRIAKVLSDCETLIQKRKESIELLDEFLKSTFLEMFGDPVRNDKGWDSDLLANVTTKIGSGSTPRGGKSAYINSGISLIRSLNVHDGFFKLKNLAFINKDQAKKLDNVTIEKNDLLFNITGASVCRVTVVPDEILPARVNQHVAIIRTKDDKLKSIFLSYLLSSKNFKKFLLNKASLGGATREALTKDQLEKIEIPIPPIELQKKFAKIVEKNNSIRSRLSDSLIELENLYGSLSQKAFKGELDLSKVDVSGMGEGVVEKVESTIDVKKEKYNKFQNNKFLLIEIIKKNFKHDSFSFKQLVDVISEQDIIIPYDKVKNFLFESLEGDSSLLVQELDQIDKHMVFKIRL